MSEEKELYTIDETIPGVIGVTKQIAEITLCGNLRFAIFDDMPFVRPTEEQIKNLREMLCVDVKLFD